MNASPAHPDHPPWLPALAWLLGSLFFFYAWVLRVSPSVIVDELMRDFAVGGAIVGHLSALYFYGYAGMQIPVGLLLDRFGPRRLMSSAAVVCAGGCLVFALSESLGAASLGRFLMGAGAAFSLVGAMAVAGQWFPARRFALLGGLAMLLGMLGGVVGQAPVRLVVEALGWRDTLLGAVAAGLVLAGLLWLTVRDRVRGAGGIGAMIEGLRVVGANRQTWLVAAAGLGATGPLLAYAGLWGVPYLEVAYGIERSAAGAITSLTFLGFGVGAPLVGALSDTLGRRRLPLLAGLATCAVCLAWLIWVPGVSLAGARLLAFLLGLTSSVQIVCFALVREHNPVRYSATAIGVVNAFVTGAGALVQPAMGWVLDLNWDGELVGGARIYDLGAYRAAFVLLLAGCIGGFFCALAVRERAR
ncbi:MAG: MFS transporter [Gammaproteobacteria bacterium]|nr:MFS transporter [Gammaproteobacteria bacterium]